MTPPPTLNPMPHAATLSALYDEPGGVHDEMKSAGNDIRAPWATLAAMLDNLGGAEIARRWVQGRRMIQDNGVTYNVYGDPRGMDRPWHLDPIPMVVGHDEWASLEAGLIQRARLLNAVCADLYGPQTLLRDGHIPAELVLGHPRFLRPCHNLPVAKQRYVSLVAFDLARSPDGRWWVLGDRTQAPSGAGYALENRLVVSRTFPAIFRDCRVQRLARFFAQLRDTLRAMSPRVGENPRIVLLTPGPFNETFFEHAYLARYLGFTLAQGDDLTVRDNKVFLKTLGGLRRVDVILRRLDDDFCDPLELRGDSALGVPGLVQAAWAGNVAIANALGTGLLETPALMPFYPGLCRTLLDEDLQLPGVATWWCGQPKELAHVETHLHKLVVKPAYPGAAALDDEGKPLDAAFGDALSEPQREALIGRMRERPDAYLAQESVRISTAPVFDGGKLTPRHLILRAYVAADDAAPLGYGVMPGGLTRIGSGAESRVTSMQRGGGSKDTWVASDGPVSTFSLLTGDGATPAGSLAHDSFDLPSRVADNLFWLGRYIERSEGLVRLLRSIVSRLTDDAQPGATPEVIELVRALDALTLGAADLKRHAEEKPSVESRVLAVLFDPGAAGGLADTLTRARRLASIARDRISLDTWRILGQLDRDYQQQDGQAAAGASPRAAASGDAGRGLAPAAFVSPFDDLGDALELLDRMVITLAAFTGLGHESMLRNQGYRFLDMGRRIERAFYTVRMLRTLLVRPRASEGAMLDAMLEVLASAMTYRQRYLSTPAALPALDLVLLDETNPRSVAYQIAQIVEHLGKLPRPEAEGHRRGEDQRLALGMLTSLQLADPVRLADPGDRSIRDALGFTLAGLDAQLPELSDAIGRQFLSHNALSGRLGQKR